MEEFVYRVREKENTHSRIIADLLNPKGSHNQGSIFLESFLRAVLEQYSSDTVNRVDFNYEAEFFIGREFCIKEYSSDRTDSGRIDIYIELKNVVGKDFGIIIENKINDASFQPNQLARYVDAIKNKFNRENKKDSTILTVCIPRLCNTRIEDQCAIILPDKLGDIFESAIKFCTDTHVSNTMTSYITCLRNINLINASMNNSKILFEFLKSNKSDIKVSDIKTIINAYSQLPTYYLESIDKTIKERTSGNSDIKHTIGSTLKGYLDIWDEGIYRKKETWQWLSLTVDHNCIYFYIVSNEKDSESRDKKAKSIGYGLGQPSGGVTWYKPINSSGEVDVERFQISYGDELPNIEFITDKIFNILNEMRKVSLDKNS
ncbi:MAG: PD-(D/E)XK nuclease family protein [Barnesiella sp.]|nr:PD-(D/E)XK nuclease family protein [Barnesiella sp.]